MAVSTAIKDYIANMYCNGTVDMAGVDAFTDACMLDSLKTPLPAGETHATICTGEVLNWCANNIGYTPSGAPPPEGVSTAIKNYVANTYCAGTITLAGVDAFTDACMLDSLKTPLPAGETHATICTGEVLNWCANNIGYTPSGAPPPGPPGPPEPSGPYVAPSPPPTGYAQLRLCTVPGGVHPVIDDDVNPQVTYPCSDLNPRWVGVNVPIGGAVQKYKVQFELLPDFVRQLNTAKKSASEDYWGPFVDGQVVHIRHGLVASPGAAMGVIFMNAKDIDTQQWLAARPNINGIGGEEHMLMLGEEGLTLDLPVGTYEVTCTYPGYRTPDRVIVRLTEDFGVSDPYIIPTFFMKEVKIHKVVEVRERAMKAAWVTAFDIESPLIHGVPSKGSITFEFLEEAAYRVFFALHPLPAGWDQSKPVGELPASVINVFCSITGDYTIEAEGETVQVLNPILHTNRKYKAPFEVILERGPNAVPPGWYVAVTVIERWKEIL